MPSRLTPLWLQLAALLAAAPLCAQHAATHDEANAPSQSSAGTGFEAGQRVGVDPQTGRLRGLTPEEARALVASLIGSLDQSDVSLVPNVLPNGATALDLQGRFESATLAKIGADGQLTSECVTSAQEAERFLSDAPEQPAPVTPALEEQ